MKNKNSTFTWYKKLKKPNWAPPSFLFAPVWTILYILITFSFGTVFIKVLNGQLPALVAVPFILNLFFNFIFSPIQFNLQNNRLAALDIILVLLTLILSMFIIYPHIPWVAYIQIPYLLWVSFATVLQLTVTWLNK